MVELIRTNDLVHLSWAQAMLGAAGIEYLLVDLHTSSIEGGIGAFPRRLLVPEGQLVHARWVLDDAAAAAVQVDDDG